MSGGGLQWRALARLSLLRVIVMPLASAIPRSVMVASDIDEDPGSTWLYLATAAFLVILGGAFSGLTIALMGQDEINLKVLQASGEPAERRNATKVLRLLERGKHWVLVTLLLGNVITNETLPIVLDRSLGGGWQAVLGSTVLIVIFGEIVPQSVCVRFGLPIGAFMAPFTRLLMWLLAPVGYPTARLLDFLLGQDHGTTYKKDGLKTLVTLHRTYGISPTDRLNRDEVTIISAVLDLRAKPVGNIMTPMEDVFTLSADTILDAEMMDTILSEGYSRVPIYAVNDPKNFVGMLLVKMLITYDPEDCLRVDEFPLATLPETRPETSCLDIVNFFQEGKSHMVLVSSSPGDPYGALGVCTLEDVIEELIGEEIIDESDVFVDVHKAIRRMHPVSYYRIPKAAVDEGSLAVEGADLTKNVTLPRKLSPLSDSQARGPTAKLKRRRSSGGMESIAIRNQDPQLRRHLSHLGPSNLASAPKQTRINTVKIKPAHVALSSPSPPRPRSTTPDPILSPISPTTSALQNEDSRQSPNPETSLLSAGYRAGDAVRAVNYGTLTASPKWKPRTPVEQLQQAPTQPSPLRISEGMYGTDHGPQSASKDPGPPQTENTSILIDATDTASYTSMIAHAGSVGSYPAKFVVTPTRSVEQISLENESLEDENESRQSGAAGTASPSVAGPSSAASAPEDAPSRLSVARSGSIFERGLEVGGVPKVVLDVHDDQLSIRLEDTAASATGIGTAEGSAPGPSEIGEDRAGSRGDAEADAEPRKKRRRRYKKKKPKGGPSVGEDPGSADGGVAL